MPCFGLHTHGFTVPAFPAGQCINGLSCTYRCVLPEGSAASSLAAGRVVSVPEPRLSPSVLVYGCVSGEWGDFPQRSRDHRQPPSFSRTYIYVSRFKYSLMQVLTEDEGKIALRLARRAIEDSFSGSDTSCEGLPEIFYKKRGVFVTLNEHSMLRGCIGLPYPVKALGDALIDAARSAAFNDPRFSPVSEKELDDLDIEITVLTEPEMMECSPEERPDRIEVGRHGLMLRHGFNGGLLLPQVAVDYRWDNMEFLEHTCMKAGLPANCWKRSDVDLYTFEGQIFSERKTEDDD